VKCLNEPLSIARYLSKVGSKGKELLRNDDPFMESKVDQWNEWTETYIKCNVNTILQHIFGKKDRATGDFKTASVNVKKYLKFLDQKLNETGGFLGDLIMLT
jgi:hypothetical protein